MLRNQSKSKRSTVNSLAFEHLTGQKSKVPVNLTERMTDHLSERISVFESFHSEPKTITLGQWLKACKNGSRYAKQVIQYRRTKNQDIKKSLPLVTVGAICETGRKKENVVRRTGWIALDIDAKDNKHIKDAEHLRNEIVNITFVAFSALSVSGAGVWALIKVSNPEKQDLHFKQLQKDFESLGITLDSTKGKNPNDARFYSFDSGAIQKSSFNIYNRLPVETKNKDAFSSIIKTSENDVEELIQQIVRNRIDITGDYEEWRNIGFAFADEYGETGREYFHTVSQFHPDYNQRETDRQFTYCLKSNGSGITIATFFYLCKQYGIELNKDKAYYSPTSFKRLEAKYESQSKVELNESGYPANWDNHSVDVDNLEYEETVRCAFNDCDNDFERLMILDNNIALLNQMFGAEPTTSIKL